MGSRLDDRKIGKYAELSNNYNESVKGPITITYAVGKTIDLAGHDTIGNFQVALTAAKTDNPTLTEAELNEVQIRVRDMHKVSHTITYAELQIITALGCSAGNALWNKKVDLQDQCMAIEEGDYADEDAAIAAVGEIMWS